MNPVVLGIGALLLGAGAKKAANRERREREERDRRRSSPLKFPDGICQQDFEEIAKRQASKIKRIKKVRVSGGDVTCMVVSQSGISEWTFTIDMNDYGSLVGNYWISSQNGDSNIPKALAERIQDELLGRC